MNELRQASNTFHATDSRIRLYQRITTVFFVMLAMGVVALYELR